MWTRASRVAVAGGSAVPVLRANRGWAPPRPEAGSGPWARWRERAPPPGGVRLGQASGRLFGLQFADHLQRVVDVPADVGHGVENMPDRALAVDHVGDPAGYQAEHRRHPVALAHLPALVAEQRERQVVLAGEASMLVHRVGADPDHLRA